MSGTHLPVYDPAHLREAAENSAALVCVKRLDGRYAWVNAAFARMLMQEPAALVGRRDTDLFDAATAQTLAAHDAEAVAARSLLQFEEEIRLADGDHTFIALRVPLVDDAGDIYAICSLSTDISAIKRSQALLARTESALREMHRITSDTSLTFIEKTHDLLRLGTQQFGLPIGILARVEGDRYEIVAAISPGDALKAGDVFGLGDTYCTNTLKSAGALYFEHAAVSTWRNHPCYQKFALESYLGIRLVVNGKTFGTLNFSSPDPHPFLFSPADIEILNLMGQWMSGELERKQAADALIASETRFRDVVNAAGEYVWEVDHDWRYTYLSRRIESILGCPCATLLGRSPLDSASPEFTAAVAAFIDDKRSRPAPFMDFEYVSISASGNSVWLLISGTPIFDAGGQLLGYRGVGQDISERKRYEARIEYLATRDTLTALLNRGAFQKELEAAVAALGDGSAMLAFLFIDLDRFKTINDSLGHPTGDELLRVAAKRIEDCLGADETVARFGGDEFGVLLKHIGDYGGAIITSEKIIGAIAQPYRIGNYVLDVTCSIGITLCPHDGRSLEVLLRNADTAMYEAKGQGGNGYRVFSAEMNARIVQRMDLERALRRGLEHEEFELYYQPLLEVDTNRLIGFEALVRWNHPEMGVLSPSRFVPIAEDIGFIIPLGEWILQTACEQARKWHASGYPDLRVSVNCSARQLNWRLVKLAADALKSTGLDAKLLDVEITESTLMTNLGENTSILRALREMGAEVFLDDFGTGYSSLSQLKQLPINGLKIDQSFVRQISASKADAAIVRAIILMAETLKLRVISEGVETASQLEILRLLDCDEYQGFISSRPLPAQEFEARFLKPALKAAPVQ